MNKTNLRVRFLLIAGYITMLVGAMNERGQALQFTE
jgi:ribosomal protein S17E